MAHGADIDALGVRRNGKDEHSPQTVQRYRQRRPHFVGNEPWPTMVRPSFPRLSHPRLAQAIPSTPVAAVPDECAGQFGPQLAALIAYLTVVCRLPRLVVQRLLADVLQIPLSLGSTQHAWEEASAAVAAPYKELRQALANQPVFNADETGHRTNGAKRWLWTLVAPTFVFYTIATSRGADVLRHLLGTAFAGVLGSDRLSTYLTYPAAHRQFCWAHFRRNLLSAQDLATTAAARRFCREALTLQRQLFRLWHRFRGDPRTRGAPLTRAQLVAKVLPIEKCLFALAERYVNAPDVKVSNLARALFVHHAHFFTFVHEEAVAPTNNVAERALRTAVQWRKIMFGNRSAEGERAVARLLTVTRTCQLQQLHVRKGPGSGEELRRRLAAACVPWAVGLKRHVQLRRERRLRQCESPTIGSHQAHGCRPPCRLARSDQLSRSTGRALRSLCRSPTACRQVSASAREPSGPTGWSARSKPRAWSSRTSASSANRATADLKAPSTVGDDAGSLAMTVTPYAVDGAESEAESVSPYFSTLVVGAM